MIPDAQQEFVAVNITQTVDSPCVVSQIGQSELVYLYSRSSESYVNNVAGQDYLSFRQTADCICFANCDGVGQSFCGDLAAKFLGDKLVEWLWDLPTELLSDRESFEEALSASLSDWTERATKLINAYPITDFNSELMRLAFDEQRKYGSEAMFVCGRLDLENLRDNPRNATNIILAWLGDSSVRVYDLQGNQIDINDAWSSSERWSSRIGIKGAEKVHVWFGGLENISCIIAHSDGLNTLNDQLYLLGGKPEELQREVDRLRSLPTSDDISMINIRLIPDVPKFKKITNRFGFEAFSLVWEPSRWASHYLVQELLNEFSHPIREWKVTDNKLVIDQKKPGNYIYRIKACNMTMDSKFSVSEQVMVSYIYLLVAVLIVAGVVGGWWLWIRK